MLALFATMIDTGRIMENTKQLPETFFRKYFDMFNIPAIFCNG